MERPAHRHLHQQGSIAAVEGAMKSGLHHRVTTHDAKDVEVSVVVVDDGIDSLVRVGRPEAVVSSGWGQLDGFHVPVTAEVALLHLQHGLAVRVDQLRLGMGDHEVWIGVKQVDDFAEVARLDTVIGSRPSKQFAIGQAEQPVDCLLYTSPSPRDLSTSRMPSSA